MQTWLMFPLICILAKKREQRDARRSNEEKQKGEYVLRNAKPILSVPGKD